LTYLSADAGVDAEKANDVVRRVAELRSAMRSDSQAKPELQGSSEY